jgi:endonuclease/exonuclease/phosphatase family metal-dependent hydrolase
MTFLRVMSFNVFLTTLGEDEIEHPSNIWANRADLNVRTIQRYYPDLIGFQELDAGHRATYAAHLSGYDGITVDDRGEDIAAILWRADRFERHAYGTFFLGSDSTARVSDWGAEDPLDATWVHLRCRQDGQELLLLNTQFDDESERSRVKSAELVVARIDRLQAERGDIPVIVTGDFNCNPWSAASRIFLAAGFVDTFRAAGHGDSAGMSTFHGFHGADYFALEWGDQLFWRVDWILARGGAARQVQTTSCTIIRDAEPPIYPSDHWPVVTELLLLPPN